MDICKRFKFFWLILLFGCSIHPVSGDKDPHLLSQTIGKHHFEILQQIEGGLYNTDPSIPEYVKKVGTRLTQNNDNTNVPFEFVLINHPIPNAWAFPGGKIAITRGLLEELESEGELAAVLTHEIVRSSKLMESPKLKYTREEEFEIDRKGIEYLSAAGYDPQVAIHTQKILLRQAKLKNPSWTLGYLSTHSPTQERIIENETTASVYPQGGIWGTEEYKIATNKLKKDKKAYALLNLGTQAFAKGELTTALNHALDGIQIEPNEAHLYHLKGKTEAALGNYPEALLSYDKAIRLNPHYFDFFLQKGLLEYKLGTFQSAKESIKKSTDLFPSYEGLYTLGMIDLNLGFEKEAIFHFKQASKSDTHFGLLAGKELAKIDLPRNPSEYLTIQPEGSLHGFLKLSVDNQSVVPLKNITLQLTFYNAERKPSSRRTVTIHETIKPKQKLLKTTSIAPPSKNKAIHIEILRVEIVP